jgi:predicted RecA/RadA family phage recombinase
VRPNPISLKEIEMKMLILFLVIAVAVAIAAIGPKRFITAMLQPVEDYVQKFLVLHITNYVYSGDHIDITTPYAVSSGGGCLVGARLFGIAVDTYGSGVAGVMCTEGVFDIAKATAISFAAGAPVYWDDTNKVCTTSGTGSALEVGIATSTAGTAAVLVRARLNEPAR